MTSIYNFSAKLKNDLITTQKENNFFLPFLLLLVTIVFPLGVNNVALAIFVVFLFIKYKQLAYSKSIYLIAPVLLFFWMSLSYFWSIDKPRTLKAIPKEVSLFLIPLIFMLIPAFTFEIKRELLKYYSYSIVLVAIFFLLRAFLRYFLLGTSSVFFYHGDYDFDTGLVPKLLNAIHVSVFATISFFYFFTKKSKSQIDYAILAILALFILLLSSKNIILVFVFLVFIYTFFFSEFKRKKSSIYIIVLVFLVATIAFFGRIRERFLIEFQSGSEIELSENFESINTEDVHVVTIQEAWNKKSFSHSDFFPGSAFRVYQTRIGFEFLNEEPVFWKGFGLNASLIKLQEKEKKYNLYPGYGTLNFHNQYLQNFIELGFIGFLLLIIILSLSIYKAFLSKDFMHITFTILMISLFLTESFLWRQRGVVFFMAFYCLFMMDFNNKVYEKNSNNRSSRLSRFSFM